MINSGHFSAQTSCLLCAKLAESDAKLAESDLKLVKCESKLAEDADPITTFRPPSWGETDMN